MSWPETSAWTAAERQAVILYAVAACDFSDFLDLLDAPASTRRALELLLQMCLIPNPTHAQVDAELNRFIAKHVKARLSL